MMLASGALRLPRRGWSPDDRVAACDGSPRVRSPVARSWLVAAASPHAVLVTGTASRFDERLVGDGLVRSQFELGATRVSKELSARTGIGVHQPRDPTTRGAWGL